jgi:hypothetical protein
VCISTGCAAKERLFVFEEKGERQKQLVKQAGRRTRVKGKKKKKVLDELLNTYTQCSDCTTGPSSV